MDVNLLPSPPPTDLWVRTLCLENNIIQSGEWLNDRHITAAQTLIQQGHSHIDGLQCPLLAQSYFFKS